ncbi:hypothetical protein IWQ60_000603 [Tieghemiomyces parasiticus]|uniref:glutathione gamma-glutamylcysteinyltransferase n=1 Tax=Tieghemiomyces parasiticus TaxID=78921 RepID=A0A9W8AFM4_9FUNG|nr:hypothetical protein IWQ60_000603 [Tieghemiomyces parasiticus]
MSGFVANRCCVVLQCPQAQRMSVPKRPTPGCCYTAMCCRRAVTLSRSATPAAKRGAELPTTTATSPLISHRASGSLGSLGRGNTGSCCFLSTANPAAASFAPGREPLAPSDPLERPSEAMRQPGISGSTFTPYRHAEPQTTWNPYPPASKPVEPNATIASPRVAPSVIGQATPVSPATTTIATTPTTNPSFYRRQLPAILTSFTSPEGRARFKESLLSGYAEGYFNLAGNFTTQSEPAFCGPSSLAMVLNALEVDPGQPWKGVWRWYSDELIKTCAEPEVLKRTGITFEQFACMAVRHCDIQARRGREGPNVTDSPGTVSLAQFRKDVRRVCAGTDEFMVVSFARKVLQQTGDGHFSPIGAYHPETDSVLVLDTARFKYPSFFVPLETLYEALHPVDKTTGKSRGYFLIRRALPKKSPLEEATTADGETVAMPGRVGGECCGVGALTATGRSDSNLLNGTGPDCDTAQVRAVKASPAAGCTLTASPSVSSTVQLCPTCMSKAKIEGRLPTCAKH